MRNFIGVVSYILFILTLQVYPQWSTNPSQPLIVGYGQDPKICSDGNGGCYITHTFQSTSYPKKLAVQRLDRWGYRPWGLHQQIPGELPAQQFPQITSDQSGGVIISYSDLYWDGINANYFVRVQRVDSSGNLLWAPLGVRVSLSELSHGDNRIISDNENGAIVAWIDSANNYFINRIDSSGQRVWGDSGVFLTHHSFADPPTLVNGDDQSYYFFLSKHRIKLNQYGEIIRHDTINAIGSPVTDGQNGLAGMYISWQYYPNLQLRAIRIDSSGTNLWEPYVLVAESLYFNPIMTLQRLGNYIFISWHGNKNGVERISQFQALRLDGSLLYPHSIPADPGKPTKIRGILSTDSARIIVIWENDPNLPDSTFIQLYDTLGNKYWSSEGILISAPAFDYESFTSDLNGGFIQVGLINNFTIVAQQVSKNGILGFVPVEMTSFTAEMLGNDVNLNWQTSTETNNKGFEIEISPFPQQNGVHWQLVGFVNGAGTTTGPQNYSFTHRNLSSGKYKYRLKQIDYDGSFEYSKEIEITVGLPDKFILYQNYPNPFNSLTKIKFSLPQEENVTITLFNTLGEEVKVLISQRIKEGIHEYTLDASVLSSGIYIYRIKAGSFTGQKKLILLR